MLKTISFDDALRGIVAIQHAVDRGLELGFAQPPSIDTGACSKLLGSRNTARWIRVRASPFGDRAGVATRDARLEVILRGKAGQHGRQRAGIVTGGSKVADAEPVGLKLLTARKAQRRELRDLQGVILEKPADGAGDPAGIAEKTADDSAEHAKNRVALGIRLALLRMTRGDMADFVAEHAGQLSFVVHQGHQLARDVNIAAGDCEGVIDRRIEQRHGERRRRIRQARLYSNILPHACHIG